MPCNNLKGLIAALEASGESHRVAPPVNAALEITEIRKKGRGGP